MAGFVAAGNRSRGAAVLVQILTTIHVFDRPRFGIGVIGKSQSVIILFCQFCGCATDLEVIIGICRIGPQIIIIILSHIIPDMAIVRSGIQLELIPTGLAGQNVALPIVDDHVVLAGLHRADLFKSADGDFLRIGHRLAHIGLADSVRA